MMFFHIFPDNRGWSLKYANWPYLVSLGEQALGSLLLVPGPGQEGEQTGRLSLDCSPLAKRPACVQEREVK